MEIQNLKSPSTPVTNTNASTPKKIPIYYIIVATFGIFSAFWLSRFFPTLKQKNLSSDYSQIETISADNIKSQDVQVGKTYGNANDTFSDTATGVIQTGSINGVGTHILERDGGISQTASLTSSVLDLDLFIDRKVQIKGETNASDKTSWFLDVGSVTVLE